MKGKKVTKQIIVTYNDFTAIQEREFLIPTEKILDIEDNEIKYKKFFITKDNNSSKLITESD